MKEIKILYAISGSFCNFQYILQPLKELCDKYDVTIIVSKNVSEMDTRFFKASDFINILEKISKHKVLKTLVEAESIGPANKFDLMVIAPMTSSTCSKLVHGSYDHVITLAAKAMLRNQKNILCGLSCNDALGISGTNIFKLLNQKHIYVIPFFQDAPLNKPNSVVSCWELLDECVKACLDNQQIQPILRQK